MHAENISLFLRNGKKSPSIQDENTPLTSVTHYTTFHGDETKQERKADNATTLNDTMRQAKAYRPSATAFLSFFEQRVPVPLKSLFEKSRTFVQDPTRATDKPSNGI